MSDQTVKLQVPMDKDVRDAFEKRATALGFDSAQAYIRFWAKAEVDGRKVDLNVDAWGEPSPEAAARLNRDAEEAMRNLKAGKLKSFDNADDMMRYLNQL
jgi:hypothetical protein